MHFCNCSFSTQCGFGDPTWASYFPIMITAVIAYPVKRGRSFRAAYSESACPQVGIPLLFLGLLVRHRRALRDPSTLLYLGFLTEGYNDEQWWWEFVSHLSRLSLVS